MEAAVESRTERIGECPICGWVGRFWIQWDGEADREGSRCGRCGAWDRHRAVKLVIDRDPGSRGYSYLLVSPSVWEFKYAPGARTEVANAHGSVDFDLTKVMKHWEDGRFGFIVATDIMDWVEDVDFSVGEIHRMCKIGCIIFAPKGRELETIDACRKRFAHVEKVMSTDFDDRFGLTGDDPGPELMCVLCYKEEVL